MATKHTDLCLQNAGDNEPIFVLRAKDKLAPNVVRRWAAEAGINGASQEKVEEAFELATKMEVWASQNGSKLPD
jgi:hypothetical protein